MSNHYHLLLKTIDANLSRAMQWFGTSYTRKFNLNNLKARFLENKKNGELPQYNSMFREFDSDLLLNKASRNLGFDLEAARKAKKIGAEEKDKRDLLIYLLWKTGRLSNREIGAYFGLTYSAISRRVKVIKDKISAEQRLKDKYQMLKSQIKV